MTTNDMSVANAVGAAKVNGEFSGLQAAHGWRKHWLGLAHGPEERGMREWRDGQWRGSDRNERGKCLRGRRNVYGDFDAKDRHSPQCQG